MTPEGGIGRPGGSPLAGGALILLFLLALPAHGGDLAARREHTEGAGEKRKVALSIRIAEARNRPGAKRYFQGIARQQRKKGERCPATPHPIDRTSPNR